MPEAAQTISITDDSGLLSLVDVSCYSPFVSEEWTYEEILRHFERQMVIKSMLVWECGDGGGTYSIVVRRGITSEAGVREVLGSIVASADALHVVSYDALTMAAQFQDEKLPSRHEASAVISVAPGPYRVRVVQKFDPSRIANTKSPDFLIELEPGEGPQWSGVPWLRT